MVLAGVDVGKDLYVTSWRECDLNFITNSSREKMLAADGSSPRSPEFGPIGFCCHCSPEKPHIEVATWITPLGGQWLGVAQL